jgi:vitamin B12/bleomycin/antimicrobial peptide transport system ATP-binding/permease protein
MVWGAILYAGVVSLLMVTAGSSYAERVRARSQAEAQFRYELTQLRGSPHVLAPESGAAIDPSKPFWRLAGVVSAWRRANVNGAYMTIVSYGSGLAAPIIPVLLMSLRYLSDPTITFGTVMQAAAAFATVQASLAWVMANFPRLSEWYAAASRVAELFTYLEAATAQGEPSS